MFIGSYYIVLCTIKLPSCKQRCRQLWNLKVGRSRWWRHSWWHHRAVLNFKKKNGWCCLTRARTDIKITKETVYHCYSSCEMFSHSLFFPAPPPPQFFLYHIWGNYKIGLEEEWVVLTPHSLPVASPLAGSQFDIYEVSIAVTVIHIVKT